MLKFLKGLYLDLLVWWDTRKLDKFIEKELLSSVGENNAAYYEDDVARLYAEGIARIKGKINSRVKERSAEEYHEVLKQVKNLISEAREETFQEARRRKMLESAYVRRGSDVKNSRDKKKMIDERIQHYQELQAYNEQRQMLKQIKLLIKEGKDKEAQELTEQWKKLYDKNSRKLRRH